MIGQTNNFLSPFSFVFLSFPLSFFSLFFFFFFFFYSFFFSSLLLFLSPSFLSGPNPTGRVSLLWAEYPKPRTPLFYLFPVWPTDPVVLQYLCRAESWEGFGTPFPAMARWSRADTFELVMVVSVDDEETSAQSAVVSNLMGSKIVRKRQGRLRAPRYRLLWWLMSESWWLGFRLSMSFRRPTRKCSVEASEGILLSTRRWFQIWSHFGWRRWQVRLAASSLLTAFRMLALSSIWIVVLATVSGEGLCSGDKGCWVWFTGKGFLDEAIGVSADSDFWWSSFLHFRVFCWREWTVVVWWIVEWRLGQHGHGMG